MRGISTAGRRWAPTAGRSRTCCRGPIEQTIWRGRRWSTANAYLKPALKRANCTLVRGLARRVMFEDRRAVGVEIARGDRVETIRAEREAILAASSINSPKLLMQSGVGPGNHLAEHGIETLADRPGVGQNPPRGLHPICRQPTDHIIQILETSRKSMGWRPMAVVSPRPRRLQPIRKRCLHPEPCGRGISGHSISLPANRGPL